MYSPSQTSRRGQHGRIAAPPSVQQEGSSRTGAGAGCSRSNRKRTHNRKRTSVVCKSTTNAIIIVLKSVVVAAALVLIIGWIELATTIQPIPPQHWLLQQKLKQQQQPTPPTNAPTTIMSIPRNVCWIPHVFGTDSTTPIRSKLISGCIEEVTNVAELFTIPHCSFQQVVLDRTKLKWRALGGEALETVMGQPEEDEYVTYIKGALVVYSDTATSSNTATTNAITSPWIEESLYQHNASRLARRDKSLLYLKDVLDSMTFVPPSVAQAEWNRVCRNTATEKHSATTTLLLIQRYDYVNLYHTMTDIWNTWEVYRRVVPRSANAGDNAAIANTTIRVVFWDAHPSGMLDEIWTRLFGTTVQPIHAFLQQHNAHNSNITCLDSVHLIPSGFTSRITHDQQCVDPAVMDDFVQFLVSRYRLEHVTAIAGRISIVDRKPVVVHPRSSVSDITSTKAKAREISNLGEVTSWIYQWFQRREKQSRMVPQQPLPVANVSIRILPLYNMSFYDQLRAIRESQVIIGNHGAGLTHFIFMNDDNVETNVANNAPPQPQPQPHAIEFRGPGYDTFRNMMAWKPRVHYQQLPSVEYNMSRSYFDNLLRPVLDDIFFTKTHSRTGSDT